MKIAIAILLLLLMASSAFDSATCHNFGDTTYCNESNGETATIRQFGSTTYIN